MSSLPGSCSGSVLRSGSGSAFGFARSAARQCVFLAVAACRTAPPAWEAANPITPLPRVRSAPTSISRRCRIRRRRRASASAAGSSTTRGCPATTRSSCATCHRAGTRVLRADAGLDRHRRPEGRAQGADLHQPGGDALPALLLGRPRGLARGSGARPDRQPDRDGQHAQDDDRDRGAGAGLQAVLRGGLRDAGDHQGARRPGDRRLRAHAHERQLTLRSLALQPRRERRVGRRSSWGTSCSSGKAGCVQCHVGSNFTDSTFHNLGVGWDPQDEDVRGRGALRSSKDHAKRDGRATAARSRRRRCARSPSTRRTCTTARSPRCARSSSSTTAAATRTRGWIRRSSRSSLTDAEDRRAGRASCSRSTARGIRTRRRRVSRSREPLQAALAAG